MNQGNSGRWDSKIRFFSKFLGFQQEELQDTLDDSNRSQIMRRPSKGIKILQFPPQHQSMILSNQYSQEIDKKWLNLIRTPYRATPKAELLKLTYQGTSYAHKVMPWLAQNRHKINLKLFNIKRLQYRTSLNPANPFRLQKMSSQLQILINRVGQNSLSQSLGIMMLHREDIQYSDILYSIGSTVNQYLYDAPVIAFSLIYNMCCSGVYLHFLSNDIEAMNYIISEICVRIRTNCSSASFLIRDKLPLDQYVRIMIQCFWLNISENRTTFRQKIIYYLLINQMDLRAVSKVCEASIVGLSRIINQGNRQKNIEVLSNPRVVLDQEIFLNYLFTQN